MTKHPALVTGFTPYAGRGSNPAADIANALDGCVIANVPVVGRLLPVALEEIAVRAESLLDELRPRIVINVGLWPGEATVRIERVALNLADFEIPDNRGLLAHDGLLSANGPTAKFATLPIREIEEAILAAGIPSRISNSAGSFLCNACFYSFLSAAEKKQGTLCGFLHVPYLPQQVAGLLRELKKEARLEAHQRADYASMDVTTGTRAVAIALETALRTALSKPRFHMPRIILEFDRVTKQFGATVAADALSLTVQEGEFFTFLGPSGSGKSTLLRMVAGLENPDCGTIRIDGRDVAAVGPWHRNLGMMFQNYAVFPHMNVRLNVGYGLKVRRLPPGEIKQRVDAMLELMGLSSLGDKDVTLLSGGEQQRVALARALAPEPRMLLLDEPLSALDEKIRRAMQTELKHVHQRTGMTFIYVTHDQEEALTLSDRIAVIDRGQCIQCDAPERLYKRPRRRFVAEFFRGCNVLEAEPAGRRDGSMKYQLVGVGIDVPLGDVQTPGRHIALRAENVHLGPFAEQQPCRLCATLVETTFRGTVLDYRLALPDGQTLVATTTQHVQAAPGTAVEVGFSPEAVVVLED